MCSWTWVGRGAGMGATCEDQTLEGRVTLVGRPALQRKEEEGEVQA